MVQEVADDSVDEAMAGYATRVDVVLEDDGGVRVVDNARGIPVDVHAHVPVSAEVSAASLTTSCAILQSNGRGGSWMGGRKPYLHRAVVRNQGEIL
jgi:DNA gyrase/topoisomerase IV subunit B